MASSLWAAFSKMPYGRPWNRSMNPVRKTNTNPNRLIVIADMTTSDFLLHQTMSVSEEHRSSVPDLLVTQPDPNYNQHLPISYKETLTMPSTKPMTFVATAQPEAAKTFYQDVLGLKLLAEELPFALVFDNHGVMLRVQIVESFQPQVFTALGWDVADIAEAVDGLVAKGVAVERFPMFAHDARGIFTFPDGAKVAWFRDPDGNLLSLTEFSDD